MPNPIRCCFYGPTSQGQIVEKCVDFSDPNGCPKFISHGGEVLSFIPPTVEEEPVANCGDCHKRRKVAMPGGFKNMKDADKN